MTDIRFLAEFEEPLDIPEWDLRSGDWVAHLIAYGLRPCFNVALVGVFETLRNFQISKGSDRVLPLVALA